MVLLPDVRGLHPFYKDLAVRFAEAGLPAVAMDYFGRTAGTAPRGDDFEFRSHVDATTPEQIAADAAAAVVAAKGTGATRVYTVGFCFGGSQSWRLAASDIGLSGVVGFYGRPALARDLVGAMHLPMTVYEGAPHSFFDRAFADWHDAGQDAWRRILAFAT